MVFKLSALFSLDAFAGGFVVSSFVAYWFNVRFGAEPGALGAIFFAANILAGISALLAARIAKRIGLINTMVFTHIPSNILLILVPLMPTLPLAVIVLLLRFSISQMDVPTRQSYTMAVVDPDERSAAAGVTGVARTTGAAHLAVDHRRADELSRVVECAVLSGGRLEDHLRCAALPEFPLDQAAGRAGIIGLHSIWNGDNPLNHFQSIHHDGSRRYVDPQEMRLGEVVTIRLRAHPQAPIERVLLRACPDGEQLFVEMQPRDVNAVCRWWEAPLKVIMPLMGYRFLLFTADGVWWYNGSGLHRHVPTDTEDFKLLADYAAPTWARACGVLSNLSRSLCRRRSGEQRARRRMDLRRTSGARAAVGRSRRRTFRTPTWWNSSAAICRASNSTSTI